MKQITHIGPDNQEWLLVEFPEAGFENIAIYVASDYEYITFDPPIESQYDEPYWDFINLPPGQWQIMGKASEIDATVAAQIVRPYWRSGANLYTVYGSYPCGTADPKRSLESLLTSHSLNPDNTIILKKL